MKYKRFPPEGYIQKALFYSFCFFIWPIFGMHHPTDPFQQTDRGASVEILDIEYDVDIEEECMLCGAPATKCAFVVSWRMISFCNKHFEKSIYRNLVE